MTFDALGAADLLAGTPLLVVHGERDAYCSPALAQALYDRTRGDKEILWLDAACTRTSTTTGRTSTRPRPRPPPSSIEVSRLRRIDVVVRRPQAKPLSQVDGGPLGVVSRRASGGHRLVRSGSLGGGSRLRPDLRKRHRGRRGGRRRCQSRQGSLRVRRRAAPGSSAVVSSPWSAAAWASCRRRSRREAGEAWGDRATDWGVPLGALRPIGQPGGLRPTRRRRWHAVAGHRLRVSFAAHLASERGAAVSGIDAADGLVTIARARTPKGDFRVGDMFALPFPDASSDAATSFNGIWKRPRGGPARSAPGTGPGRPARPDLLGPVRAPRPHAVLREGNRALRGLPRVGQHGTGRHPERDRGHVEGHWVRTPRARDRHRRDEWPDIEIAVRALVAAGPSVPAIRAVGLDGFCDALRSVIEPMHVPGVGIRITSEFDLGHCLLLDSPALERRSERAGGAHWRSTTAPGSLRGADCQVRRSAGRTCGWRCSPSASWTQIV